MTELERLFPNEVKADQSLAKVGHAVLSSTSVLVSQSCQISHALTSG